MIVVLAISDDNLALGRMAAQMPRPCHSPQRFSEPVRLAGERGGSNLWRLASCHPRLLRYNAGVTASGSGTSHPVAIWAISSVG
jgi:hypothetical protein